VSLSVFRLKRQQLFALCMILSTAAATAWADDAVMKLEQWTMTAGGSVSLPLHFDRNDNFMARLILEPEYGIFVANGLELTGQLRYSTSLYTNVTEGLDEEYPTTYGFAVRMRYFFDTGTRFFPFIGLGLGAEWKNRIAGTPKAAIEVPIGVLIALNSYVAVHLGAPIRTYIDAGTLLSPTEVLIGYAGLQAYF